MSVPVQQLSYRLSRTTDYFFSCVQTSSEVHPTSHSTGASSTNPRYSSFVHLPLTRSNLSKLLSHSITHFFVTVGTGEGKCVLSTVAELPNLKLNTHPPLVLSLRMSGLIHLRIYLPSWHAQALLYLYL